MEAISGMSSVAVRPPLSVARAKEEAKIQQPEDKDEKRLKKPVMDEYIPEEKKESSGLYRLGKDEEGSPRIYFDEPDQAEESPVKASEQPDSAKEDGGIDRSEKKTADGKPEKQEKSEKSEKSERCTANTDRVDREIEKLKKRQKELKQQLNAETDDKKIKSLEKELLQVESELRQKDNDAYRRRHTSFT